jgi:transposase
VAWRGEEFLAGHRQRFEHPYAPQRANPVYAARYQRLTSRDKNKLTPTQAQTVIAAAILRHLHAVITTGQTWDLVIATHGKHPEALPAAA